MNTIKITLKLLHIRTYYATVETREHKQFYIGLIPEITQIKSTNDVLSVNVPIENIQFLNSIGIIDVKKI